MISVLFRAQLFIIKYTRIISISYSNNTDVIKLTRMIIFSDTLLRGFRKRIYIHKPTREFEHFLRAKLQLFHEAQIGTGLVSSLLL